MMLQRGITGFYYFRDEPPPVTDLSTFRKCCYEASRRLGGRVTSVMPSNADGSYRNFAIGTLVLPADEIAVLLNAHHPVVAFSDPPEDGKTWIQFRDHPELAEVFGSFGIYQVVPAAELEQPPTPAALEALSDIEQKQVAYWKPNRLGDVVFNWWD